MYAWGWTESLIPEWQYMKDLCEDGNTALYAVNSTTYICGDISNVIYVASGSSVDWAYGPNLVDSHGPAILHSFTAESTHPIQGPHPCLPEGGLNVACLSCTHPGLCKWPGELGLEHSGPTLLFIESGGF